MAEPKPLFTSSLIKAGGRSTARGKFAIEIKMPSLVVDKETRPKLEAIASAITETIRSNMLRGLRPDGSGPLPPVAPGTTEQREFRQERARRGGAAAPRYDRKAYPKARSNFRKRFTASKLGAFDPNDPGLPRGVIGVESGLLAKSVSAVVSKDGFTIFVANVRGLLDNRGTAPLQRVMRKLGTFWTQSGQSQAFVKQAMQAAASGFVNKPNAIDSLRKLTEQLNKAKALINSFDSLSG